jgi:hypothetical protein
VWFKVQVPSTGRVRISTFAGTMNDAVIAFYYGGCNNLVPANPTCFDDTNGNLMPSVTINGIPGTWWYIRVWGYGGTVGSFSICAQTVTSLQGDEVEVRESGSAEDRADNAAPALVVNKPDTAPETMTLEVNLFPVPAGEELTLTTELLENADMLIQLFDLNGKMVKEFTPGNTPAGDFSTTLHIGDLEAGKYMLSLQAAGTQVTKLFIKI